MHICRLPALFLACSLLPLHIALCAATGTAADNLLENTGFVHFYNNEYDEALANFEQEVKDRPEDADAYNAVAQAILYREMYRDGALESQLVTGSNSFLRRAKMNISAEDKTRFNAATDRAISIGAAALKRNPNDVHALYAMSVAHGLKANFLFLVEKAWMQSLHEAVASRKTNDRILEIDPAFIDARLLHGIVQYAVSCLPVYLRMLASVDGFHGDKEEGIKQLQLVSTSGVRNRYDADILLAAIYRRERRPKEAMPLLKRLAATFPRNYLFPLEEVQMYSDLGDKTSALQVLASVENARRRGDAGFAALPPGRLEYARGNLLFWYNDLPASLTDLKRATERADELDLSTATMAWLRLGQVYDMLGDRLPAVAAYRKTVDTAPGSDVAKEAVGYINKPYKRKAK